jgi:tetratricopeptide (TPR) repeat protein
LLSNLYRELKRYDEAIQTFKNFIEHDPTYPPAYGALINLYSENLEDYQSAIEVCQRAINLVTDSSGFFNTLGWLYLLIGNLAEADKLFQRGFSFTLNITPPL